MTQFIGICTFAAVCSSTILLISKGEKELSALISSLVYILVMIYVISRSGELFDTFKGHLDFQNSFPNLNILINAGGIALISSVASSICENTGQKGLSSAIDIFAVIEIIRLAIPLVLELFSSMLKLFGE